VRAIILQECRKECLVCLILFLRVQFDMFRIQLVQLMFYKKFNFSQIWKSPDVFFSLTPSKLAESEYTELFRPQCSKPRTHPVHRHSNHVQRGQSTDHPWNGKCPSITRPGSKYWKLMLNNITNIVNEKLSFYVVINTPIIASSNNSLFYIWIRLGTFVSNLKWSKYSE
jgi:hypothetical protein